MQREWGTAQSGLERDPSFCSTLGTLPPLSFLERTLGKPPTPNLAFRGNAVWRICCLLAPSNLLQEVLVCGTSQPLQGSHPLDVKGIIHEVKHMFYLLIFSALIFLQTSDRSLPQKVPWAL